MLLPVNHYISWSAMMALQVAAGSEVLVEGVGSPVPVVAVAAVVSGMHRALGRSLV